MLAVERGLGVLLIKLFCLVDLSLLQATLASWLIWKFLNWLRQFSDLWALSLRIFKVNGVDSLKWLDFGELSLHG